MQESNFDRAWALVGDIILIPENAPAKKLNRFSRSKLRRGLKCLANCQVATNCDPWEFWLRGKIEQRLGNFEQSLKSYLAGNKIQPNHLDTVTGVITAALELGDTKTATEFAIIAIAKWSSDELIQSLAAMSFLIAGNLEKAKEIAEHIDDDHVLSTCIMVESGERNVPDNLFEIFPDVYELH